MKIVRWIAAAALTLISLMDVGSALGGGGNSAAVRVLAPLLGLLGLAAVYGMLPWRPWGAPAALAASAVNVVSALIAMAVSSAGALAGLAVSLIALTLQVLAANVPVSLGPDAATVHAMLTTISNGRPVDPTPAQYAALTSFDQWGHDACGFTRLDVTNTAAGLTGVPPALPAGTMSVSFTNRAPPAKAGFILLVGRVRPGRTTHWLPSGLTRST